MARYEDKFIIQPCQLDFVLSLISHNPIDFVNVHPDRIVESCYFDTSDYALARQNIWGDGQRFKVRLRTYNGDPSTACLEIKKRNYRAGTKSVTPISYDGLTLPDPAHCVEFREFLIRNDVHYPFLLAPKLLVRYSRKYWTFRGNPGFRITLDSNIEFSHLDSLRGPGHFFSPCTLPLDDFFVLEAKYSSSAQLLTFRDFFSSEFSLRRTKFSKYVIGLEM